VHPYGPLVDVAYLGTTVRGFARRPRSLSALLADSAGRWPERLAVVAPAGTLTYAQLDAAVDAAVAALLAHGVRPGDRLAVTLAHDLPLYSVPFVCSRLRATALLLSAALAPDRWQRQLDAVRPAAVIADSSTRDRAGAASPAGRRRLLDASAVLPPAPLPPPSAPSLPDAGDGADDEDHPVALLATSGTTGVPKTTLVTSRGLLHAALAYVELLGLDEQPQRSLVVLPLHSIGPLSAQTTAMALVGGTCVLPADTRAGPALAALADHAITHLDAVPAWLGLLAREPAPPPLPAWRTLIYGGAPMPAGTAAALARAHPGCTLYDVWGLSETHGPATALRVDPRHPAPPGTVGTPVAGVEVRAAEGTGELEVRGANVTPGYLDDPVTTAAVLREGWLRTGDVGAVGPDGGVRILDRAKDVILRGGSNVFSVEVEQVLSAAPGVAEAAVCGIPDPLGGEAVAAAVVLAPGAALDAPGLRRLVRSRIGAQAVPRRLEALDALPRNAHGKIDKLRLRKDLA
jgi:acyl-CoA synthetase (AMP-forming)/AMP-acid ligase II